MKNPTNTCCDEKNNDLDILPVNDNKSVEQINLNNKPGNDLVMEDQQIGACCRESQEKLILLHDQLKEKLNSFLHNAEDDTASAQEIMIVVKMVMGRAQLGIYDSQLLTELCHYLQNFERIITKFKSESRRLMGDNGKLRNSIETIREELFQKEAELASKSEDKKYWQFMCEMSKLDTITEDESLDYTTCLIFTEELFAENEDFSDMKDNKTIEEFYSTLINLGKYKEAIEHIKSSLANQECRKAKLALAVYYSKIVGYIFENEEYNEITLDLSSKSLEVRKELYGNDHVSVVAALNVMAYLSWHKGDAIAAANYFHQGIKIMDGLQKKVDCATELAYQHYLLGNLLFMKGFKADGVKIKEIGVMLLESLLPKADDLWLECMASLARSLNEMKANEDALCVCCEMLDYFHESEYGPPTDDCAVIYVHALTPQEKRKECPKPKPLPNSIRSACCELAVAFHAFFEFEGSRSIDIWVELCANSTAAHGAKAATRIKDIMAGKKSAGGEEKAANNITKKPFQPTEDIKAMVANKPSELTIVEYKNIIRNKYKAIGHKTLVYATNDIMTKLNK